MFHYQDIFFLLSRRWSSFSWNWRDMTHRSFDWFSWYFESQRAFVGLSNLNFLCRFCILMITNQNEEEFDPRVICYSRWKISRIDWLIMWIFFLYQISRIIPNKWRNIKMFVVSFCLLRISEKKKMPKTNHDDDEKFIFKYIYFSIMKKDIGSLSVECRRDIHEKSHLFN